MSKKSLDSGVDFILEMILNIKNIVKRHNGIVRALGGFEANIYKKYKGVKSAVSNRY